MAVIGYLWNCNVRNVSLFTIQSRFTPDGKIKNTTSDGRQGSIKIYNLSFNLSWYYIDILLLLQPFCCTKRMCCVFSYIQPIYVICLIIKSLRLWHCKQLEPLSFPCTSYKLRTRSALSKGVSGVYFNYWLRQPLERRLKTVSSKHTIKYVGGDFIITKITKAYVLHRVHVWSTKYRSEHHTRSLRI